MHTILYKVLKFIYINMHAYNIILSNKDSFHKQTYILTLLYRIKHVYIHKHIYNIIQGNQVYKHTYHIIRINNK